MRHPFSEHRLAFVGPWILNALILVAIVLGHATSKTVCRVDAGFASCGPYLSKGEVWAVVTVVVGLALISVLLPMHLATRAAERAGREAKPQDWIQSDTRK